MVQASNWQKIQPCWIGLGWVEFWNFWGLPDGWTCVLDVGVHGIVTNLLPSSLVWNHRLGSWKTATIAILVLATKQFCEHFAFLFSALRWLLTCLKHVVVIQEFVVWQGCWTNNPHYVRLFWPLWASLESLSDRYDTLHITYRLGSYDFLSHVGFVQLSIHMMNPCLSLSFQHFAANLKQVKVDEFVIIKGMAKDQNLRKHRVNGRLSIAVEHSLSHLNLCICFG